MVSKPSALWFLARTANGSIGVKDSKGALHLTTSNGSIQATGATGQLELETCNGSIDLQADKAVVTARTVNSDITFRGSLADGSAVTGFLCESYATAGARDITALGGWRAYLASLA